MTSWNGTDPSSILGRGALNLFRSPHNFGEPNLLLSLGQGVWLLVALTRVKEAKEVQKTTRVAPNNWGSKFELLKQNQVRGHAFQFKLLILEGLKNWDKRVEILGKKGIRFEELGHLFGGWAKFRFQ
jgi:hypothetical protein